MFHIFLPTTSPVAEMGGGGGVLFIRDGTGVNRDSMSYLSGNEYVA